MRKEHLGNGQSRWVSKGLDIASVIEYGVATIVWPPDASILSREIIEEEAERIAHSYNEDEDYIVALGSPTLIAVLTWAIGRKGKALRMLEWDKTLRRYYPTLLAAAVNQKG